VLDSDDGEETWWTPLTLDRGITIKDGANLTINPIAQSGIDAEMKFIGGSQIKVEAGGVLKIDGASAFTVQMTSREGVYPWSGIDVNGGKLTMDYVDMRETEGAAIRTINPKDVLGGDPVSITNCNFDGCGLMLTGSPDKLQ